MKKCVKFVLTICTVCCVAFSVVPASAETITGVVTMSNEIITDQGMIYAIEQDEKGAELSEFEGETVNVRGSVRDDEGTKIIKVNDFSVIAEPGEIYKEEEILPEEEPSTDGENQ